MFQNFLLYFILIIVKLDQNIMALMLKLKSLNFIKNLP